MANSHDPKDQEWRPLSEFPPFIRQAFEIAGHEREESWEAFQEKWGGFEVSALQRAIAEGSTEDRIVAFFALGYGNVSSAIPLLLSGVESPVPLERWAAVLSLGILREERALPLLVALVTEFLPHLQMTTVEWVPGYGQTYVEYRFEEWRLSAIRILEDWERPELVASYRQMLETFWTYEQASPLNTLSSPQRTQRYYWLQCQNELMYALGRLGRLDEVETIGRALEMPASRLEVWRVYCILGFLRVRARYPDIFSNLSRKWNDPTLQQKVAEALAQQFGLSEEAIAQNLHSYEKDLRAFYDLMGG